MSPPPDDRRKDRPAMPPGGRGVAGNDIYWDDHNLGEVFFEFRHVGNYMRVNVIHAKTGYETFVLGPRNAGHEDLKQLGLRKLKVSLNSRS